MTVKLKEKLNYTKNLFAPVSDIEGKTLQLIEKNREGNCLCLFNKEYLVDVDHRDIEQ